MERSARITARFCNLSKAASFLVYRRGINRLGVNHNDLCRSFRLTFDAVSILLWVDLYLKYKTYPSDSQIVGRSERPECHLHPTDNISELPRD